MVPHKPYFAHQRLDASLFYPFQAATLPVGKPGWAPAPKEVATVTNGGWIEDELIDNTVVELVPVKSVKRRRSSQAATNPYKRLKVAGGRPAVAKVVTANLDSDDELIVRMKNAKYLERDIAQRLVDEGRIAYNAKTIGTRWARIKRVLARKNEELLDAGMTDWHEGDDDVLHQAIQRANEITEKAKADAEASRWRVVADQLKCIKPVTNFSMNACRRRHDELQAGIAKPTPESLANPNARVLASIAARKEKEAIIEADMAPYLADLTAQENIAANGWNSRDNGCIDEQRLLAPWAWM